jgi:hypothetical protein
MHIARTTVCTTRERNPRGGGGGGGGGGHPWRKLWEWNDPRAKDTPACPPAAPPAPPTPGGNVGRGSSRGTRLLPRAALPEETRDCGGAAGRELACGGSVWGSAAILAKRLCRDGDGT